MCVGLIAIPFQQRTWSEKKPQHTSRTSVGGGQANADASVSGAGDRESGGEGKSGLGDARSNDVSSGSRSFPGAGRNAQERRSGKCINRGLHSEGGEGGAAIEDGSLHDEAVTRSRSASSSSLILRGEREDSSRRAIAPDADEGASSKRAGGGEHRRDAPSGRWRPDRVSVRLVALWRGAVECLALKRESCRVGMSSLFSVG